VPIWAAVAVVVAAYVVRSVVLRGGDFTPDVPGDVIVAATVVVSLGMVAYFRHQRAGGDQSDGDQDPRRPD